MSPENPSSAIFVCGRCSGSGFEAGRSCRLCRGLGRASAHDGLLLSWGVRVDSFNIVVRKIRGVLDAVINLLALGFLLLGLAGLVLFVLNTGRSEELLSLAYWHKPHKYLLAVWFGGLWGCFVFYRLSVAAARRQAVYHHRYTEREAPSPLPADPAAFWERAASWPRRSRVDISRSFDADAMSAVGSAYKMAKRFGHAAVGPGQLFAASLTTPQGSVIFSRLGVKFDQLMAPLRDLLGGLEGGTGDPDFGPAVDTLINAYLAASSAHAPEVSPGDILAAAMDLEPRLQDLLFTLGLNRDQVENVVSWLRVQEMLRHRRRRFASAARLKPKSDVNRAMTAVATPYLDRLSRDLTREAAWGMFAPVIERDKEFESIFRSIEGGRRSVIIVGESGVGKDAILEGLAQRMVEEDVPEILQDKRLVMLDVGRVVAGATPAEAQERLLIALGEVAQAGNIVFAVPNIGAMVGISAGSGDSLDLAQVFGNELSRGYFFAIATATPREFAEAVESSPLGRSLVKVDLPEPDANRAIRILEAKAGSIESQNNVWFSYGALEAAVELTNRHLHDQFLPEKAIQIAREAAQAVRKRGGRDAVISADDVAGIVGEKTGIPLKAVAEDETKKLLGLETRLHGRIVGQEDAVKAVASAMRRGRSGMRDQGRPIANFLFLGPTGVGKTELAKSLADAFFGSEEAMIRLDMSEYQDKPSLYRLVGEPGGGAGGILSEAVRRKPFALVLLDEIEKAHPDILNVFLQVMDDGRLTDNVGRTVDFTNTIVIATSNAGAQFIQDEIRKGTGMPAIRDGLMTRELKTYFRPEFLNRFDDIIVFSPLNMAQTVQIARLMLKKVTRRLEDQGVTFAVTEAAVRELAEAGYDPAFGARPLRRVIQDRVDNAVAQALLEKKLRRGARLTYDAGGKMKVE